MNVTDIDDKIILRARELHLLSELKTNSTTLNAELLGKASSAFASFYNARLDPMLGPDAKTGNETELEAFDRIVQKEKDAAWAKEMREKHEKFAMYVASLTVARSAIGLAQGRLANAEGTKEGAQDLIEGAKEVLGPWLGETVSLWHRRLLMDSSPTRSKILVLSLARLLRLGRRRSLTIWPS